MAFTDQSDLYGAVHEDGINLIVKHLMRLRPSLFNYGTEYVARNTHLLCHPIDADAMVYARNNPLLTIESPLPVLGTNGLINLNYCLQLVDIRIDFHRRNIETLPPEIDDIPPQHFVLTAKACFGLGCPDTRLGELLENAMETIYDTISLSGLVNGEKRTSGNFSFAENKQERKIDPITIPVKSLKCFCLEVYALLHIETRKVGNQHILSPKLDRIEIVNITPVELENSIECYVGQVIRLGLLPRIRIALEKIVFDQLKMVSISVAPAPVANNPSIEDDQLKVFINMEVA